MPTESPTKFSGKEILEFHRYRLAEQVEEWVTEAVENLTAARKLCAEMERKNMVKTERQRETLSAVQHIIQSALEAGIAPMLQHSTELFSDFATAFADEDAGEGKEEDDPRAILEDAVDRAERVVERVDSLVSTLEKRGA